VLKGYLFASLSDPYEFQPESSYIFVARVFGIPIVCIVLIWLLWLFVSQRLILKPYLERMVDLEKKQAVAELAGKVAHNIQSPLVVVKSVSRNIRGIDETQRRLLISASSRIEKIANHLISHFTSQKMNQDSTPFCFLWPVLDSSIGEKTSILGANSQIELKYQMEEDLYYAGVPLPSDELATIFSNLLNNAIQAFEGENVAVRHIRITVKSIDEETLAIEISDTGKGISPDVLVKLVKVGGTYGKANGAGLGLKHARETLAKAGGSLTIHSKKGQGTIITLKVPRAPLPSWCPKSLNLSQVQSAVVLDDDPSVHLLWQQLLGSFPTTYLTDSTHFNIQRFPVEKTFFILDYEIIGKSTTGLDLIVQHQLGQRALLVTSYFNETEIQNAVEQAGAMMLPKFMINRVPIEFGDLDRNSNANQYDLVLIDDDPMIHELWQFSANQRGYRMKAVSDVSQLELDLLSRDISIFIDKNLGHGVSGIQVAQILHNYGFTNIFLTTGEMIARSEIPEFIREVRNKDFPLL
jgi:signal transduction histidine kinase